VNRLTEPAPLTAASVTLADKVRFLRDPHAYPGSPPVDVHETHMSWVFLAGEGAYKLKKPVQWSYLDFSTCRRREIACREEVRLNHRLAPDIYLGVAALLLDEQGLRLGAPDGETGRVVDWVVVMRRLSAGGSLDIRLQAGVGDAELDRLAAILAGFYRRARRVHPAPAFRWREMAASRALNRRVLLDPRLSLPEGLTRAILADQDRCAHALRGDMDRRVRTGRIVEGHGDLRPEHIWLDGDMRIIDALEFNFQLRQVDPLEEIAFLDLECERLGFPRTGQRLRRQALWRLGEGDGEPLYTFYRSLKAVQRARLAVAHLLEESPRTPEVWPARARLYLRLAAADLRRTLRRLSRRAGR
jgi:aminoglycoside phosphotransferase family enzyme